MTHENSEQPERPDNSRRPEIGPTDETPVTPVGGQTPSTENSEMPALGGLRFVKLTEEEGEEVWERVFAPRVTAFIPPDETDPKMPETRTDTGPTAEPDHFVLRSANRFAAARHA